MKAERAAIEAAFAAGLPRPFAIYSTRRGWRLVYVLAKAVPVLEIEPYLRGLIECAREKGLGDGAVVQADRNCKEWNRSFRLPNVMRDKAPTWEADYARVEFLGEDPLDIRAAIQPREKPQRQDDDTSGDPVEPFDLGTLSDSMRQRVRAYVEKALTNAPQRIIDAPTGEGRTTTYNQAKGLGRFVAVADLLDEDTAEAVLVAAIEQRHATRDPQKIEGKRDVMRAGFNDGEKQPFDVAALVARFEADDDYAERLRQKPARTPQPAATIEPAPAVASEPGSTDDPDPELPACPLELFPAVLGDYVRSVARTVQIAQDFPGMFALATVAAAMSHRVRTIKVGVTHDEAPALWVVACLKSGERKSAAVGLVTGPLLELERQHLAKHSAALRHYKNRKDVYDREIEKWTKEAARDGTGANSIPLARLADIEKNPPVPPTSPGLTTSDATPEAIKTMMANQNGRVFFCSSEGGIFDRLADNKQKNVDLEPLLKAHAGEPIKEHRRTSGEVVIPHAVLGLAVSLQPFVVESLLANDRFNGTGFLARMLLAFPKAMAGSRTLAPQALDAGAVAAYSASLAKLYDGRTTADVVLRLDGDAWAAWNEFALAIEQRLGSGRDLAGDRIISWASKLPGAVVRIAAVFHVAEHGLGVPGVSADAVRAAAEFANRYLIPHAVHAFTSEPVFATEEFAATAPRLVAEFLREATEPEPGSVVAFSALWAAFESWRQEQGEDQDWPGWSITERIFAHALTKLGFARGKTSDDERGREGLRLLEEP